MRDHPILGVMLFLIGGFLVGFAYYISNASPFGLLTSFDARNARDAVSFLALGHLLAFNGVLFVVLGCRDRTALRLPLRA